MERAYEAYNNFGLRNLTLRFGEFLFLYTFMRVCGVWVCTGYLCGVREPLLQSLLSFHYVYSREKTQVI